MKRHFLKRDISEPKDRDSTSGMTPALLFPTLHRAVRMKSPCWGREQWFSCPQIYFALELKTDKLQAHKKRLTKQSRKKKKLSRLSSEKQSSTVQKCLALHLPGIPKAALHWQAAWQCLISLHSVSSPCCRREGQGWQGLQQLHKSQHCCSEEMPAFCGISSQREQDLPGWVNAETRKGNS